MTDRLRIVTCNDDYTNAASNVPGVAPDHDVIFVQEGKRTPLDPMLGKGWGVHQVMDTEATQGSALAWRKSVVEVTKADLTFGVSGGDLLDRSGAWARGRAFDQRVFLMSWHRVPLRDDHLWPVQDAHLADRVDNALDAGRTVIIGMDANQRNPEELARRCGLVWHAPDDSIDGFLVSPGVKVTSVCRLPKGSSDHHPVSAIVHL